MHPLEKVGYSFHRAISTPCTFLDGNSSNKRGIKNIHAQKSNKRFIIVGYPEIIRTFSTQLLAIPHYPVLSVLFLPLFSKFTSECL